MDQRVPFILKGDQIFAPENTETLARKVNYYLTLIFIIINIYYN